MKCSATPLSLHQHVWHIEWISMTTLTFSGGAENCFKRMESTDPSWELRCYARIYYMAFKSFLWNVWVYPEPSEGRHGDVWSGEQIWQCLCISEVATPKEVNKEPVYRTFSTCSELIQSLPDLLKRKDLSTTPYSQSYRLLKMHFLTMLLKDCPTQ